MELFKDFIHLEKNVLEHPSFKEIIPNIFVQDFEEVQNKYTLFRSSTEFYTNLINIFKSLADNLPNEKTKPRFKKQKLTNFIKFIYFTLSDENDHKIHTDSVWIHATNVLLAYINFTSDSELTVQSNTSKVYLLALKRLTKRFNDKNEFSQDLMHKFVEFVSKQNICFAIMKETILFLDLFSSTYYNMITSLEIFDKQCATGFLAFVSLLKVLTKDYRDPAMRRSIIKFLFFNFETKYGNSTNLTSVQKGIVYSNFLLLFRQASDYFLHDPDSIIYSIIVSVKSSSNSKMLTMIANQLQFETFKKFAIVLIKISEREHADKYQEKYQTFYYNLLESPYIHDEEEETAKEHLKIKSHILEALLWPLHEGDYEKIEKSIHLFNKVLMLNDVETRIVAKDFITNHASYNENQILGLVYQYCAINWEQSCKVMNRYYILLFCNIYKIKENIDMQSFMRFSVLMKNADIVDLKSCIKTLISVVTKQGFMDRSISYIILNVLTKNALSPNLEYVHYLKVLYEVIFKDTDEIYIGEDIAALMENLDVDLGALFERMRIQNYINHGTIKYLCQRISLNNHVWLVFQKLLPNFPNVPLPNGIILYWQNKPSDTFLRDPNCKSFFIVICKAMETKSTFDSAETDFFTNFCMYLQTEILRRRIPLDCFSYALVILRRITDIIQIKYSAFMIFYQELEMKIRKCMETISNNNDNSWKPNIFPRDVLYYSEMNKVFGDKCQFQIFESTVIGIKKGLKIIKEHYKEYPEIFDYILKCITGLCARSEELVAETVENLKFILIEGKPKSQLNALCCLYDLALTRTGNYDIILKHIFKLLCNDSDYIKETSALILYKLIKEDHLIPDQYQMFSIVYNLAEKSLKRNFNYFTPAILQPHYDKLIEKNFIYILLFFNKYYNHPNYMVSQSDLEKIDKYFIPFDKRHIIYDYMFSILPCKTVKRILTNVYTVLVENFFLLNIGYPRNYELLQDIVSITLHVLRTEHVRDYPKKEEIYKETLNNTLDIVKGNFKKPENTSKKIDENDTFTKQILNGLLNIFNKLDQNGKYVVEDIFHVILAFFEFNKQNLKNIVHEEGSQTKLVKSILKGIDFYNENLQLFHFEKFCSVSIETVIDCDIDQFERI